MNIRQIAILAYSIAVLVAFIILIAYINWWHRKVRDNEMTREETIKYLKEDVPREQIDELIKEITKIGATGWLDISTEEMLDIIHKYTDKG